MSDISINVNDEPIHITGKDIVGSLKRAPIQGSAQFTALDKDGNIIGQIHFSNGIAQYSTNTFAQSSLSGKGDYYIRVKRGHIVPASMSVSYKAMIKYREALVDLIHAIDPTIKLIDSDAGSIFNNIKNQIRTIKDVVQIAYILRANTDDKFWDTIPQLWAKLDECDDLDPVPPPTTGEVSIISVGTFYQITSANGKWGMGLGGEWHRRRFYSDSTATWESSGRAMEAIKKSVADGLTLLSIPVMK